MKELRLFLLLYFLSNACFSQKKINGYFNFKAGGYFTFNGGIGINVGTAYWIERKLFQKIDMQNGINTSFNLLINHYSLGNKNRAGSRVQMNTILSPMTVFGITKMAYYDEINPFYFGNANAMINNNQNRFVIGSSLVLTPKSNLSLANRKFIGDNVYTSKNKAQQLIFFNLKLGYRNADSSGISFELSHCNDNMIIPNLFQKNADHYDRYYTGGTRYLLNIIPKNLIYSPIKLSFVNEIYTGSFNRDLFDFPDIYDVDAPKFDSNEQAISRNARYVAQDPGERMLNVGRKLFMLDIPIKTGGIYNGNLLNKSTYINLIAGKQGGENGMRFQNKNHSKKPINKVNALRYNPDFLYNVSKKEKQYLERVHHFYPATARSRWVVGGSLNLIQTNSANNQ